MLCLLMNGEMERYFLFKESIFVLDIYGREKIGFFVFVNKILFGIEVR